MQRNIDIPLGATLRVKREDGNFEKLPPFTPPGCDFSWLLLIRQ